MFMLNGINKKYGLKLDLLVKQPEYWYKKDQRVFSHAETFTRISKAVKRWNVETLWKVFPYVSYFLELASLENYLFSWTGLKRTGQRFKLKVMCKI